MSIECKILEQPYRATLSIRTRAAVDQLPQVLGDSFGLIACYLEELGEKAGAERERLQPGESCQPARACFKD